MWRDSTGGESGGEGDTPPFRTRAIQLEDAEFLLCFAGAVRADRAFLAARVLARLNAVSRFLLRRSLSAPASSKPESRRRGHVARRISALNCRVHCGHRQLHRLRSSALSTRVWPFLRCQHQRGIALRTGGVDTGMRGQQCSTAARSPRQAARAKALWPSLSRAVHRGAGVDQCAQHLDFAIICCQPNGIVTFTVRRALLAPFTSRARTLSVSPPRAAYSRAVIRSEARRFASAPPAINAATDHCGRPAPRRSVRCHHPLRRRAFASTPCLSSADNAPL